MLTNKDIIEALTNVGYSLEEISKWTKIDVKNLYKMKNNEEIKNEYNEYLKTHEEDEKIFNENLNQFFRLNISEVDISKLEDEKYGKQYLIITPSGCKRIISYKDEGKQNCLKIIFDNFETIITDKQEVQLSNNQWVTADKLKVGNWVKVFDEEKAITAIETVNDVDCCSITVEGDEYYLDGVITK